MRIGLRIDVDTFRGTKLGVPCLCELLADHNAAGTFFFSVGPDNMGRNLWRLLRPSFLRKMIRSKAASLYGWDILLCGTFWPGPIIGRKLAPQIAGAASHETGLHAWDHYSWQNHLDGMNETAIHDTIGKGLAALAEVTGKKPVCSAAPAWKCNDSVLRQKEKFGLTYNSDCRGHSIFLPTVDGETLTVPQVPSTLPTYDEVIGRDGIDRNNYNDFMFSQLKSDRLNVLTIHAEVEGIACRELFASFLSSTRRDGIDIVSLGDLLRDCDSIPTGRIVREATPGREGWVARQART